MKFPWQRSRDNPDPSVDGTIRGGLDAGAAIDATARQMTRMAAAAKALPVFASIPIFCLAVFVTISFIGTYTGMLQVLQSGDNSFGFLGVAGVFLFILAATIIMAYSVSEMFKSGRSFWPRVSLVVTYIVTLLISVSFGFAFYWTQLEARSQAVGDAQRYLNAFDREITVADQQLAGTLTTLATVNADFNTRAAAERASGNQCGETSGGGDGPRTRHLAARAGEINALVMALTPQIDAVRTDAAVVRTEFIGGPGWPSASAAIWRTTARLASCWVPSMLTPRAVGPHVGAAPAAAARLPQLLPRCRLALVAADFPATKRVMTGTCILSIYPGGVWNGNWLRKA